MKFIADEARRKWPFVACDAAQVGAIAAVAALMLCAQHGPAEARRSGAWPQDIMGDLFGDARPKRRRAAAAFTKVPLPQPRPAEAPAPNTGDVAKPDNPEKPAEEKAAAAPPATSACRIALTDTIAIAPSIADIHGPGSCGGEDLVRLEAVVLPDNSRVAVKPAAILRCKMASALADWVRSDIAPLAAGLSTKISDLDNFDSFECRGMNRVAGARLSEHGRANAIDIRALKFANGQSLTLTDRAAPRALRETVLQSVCARFTTVLGPGSDWYHEDHIHLDLSERRSGYRICQWNVYDPLPVIAPLLPASRPDDAPPREVAAKADAARRETSQPAAIQSDDADDAKPEAPPEPRARKKRRSSGAF